MNKRPVSLLGERWFIPVLLLSMLLIGAVSLVMIGAHPDIEKQPAVPQRVNLVGGVPGVTLDLPTQAQMGVVTATVKKASEPLNIQGYAIVRDIQGLIDLSNSYTKAKAELDLATIKADVSRKSLDRAQSLFKDQKNFSAAQVEAAKVAYRSDEAARLSAQSNTNAVLMTTREQWGSAVALGIENGSPDLTGLLEHQLALVDVSLAPGMVIGTPPDHASVQLGDGSSAPIRFLSDATSVDPRTQGMRLIYVTSADRRLPTQISLTAQLSYGETSARSQIPATAVVSWGGAAWIYVCSDHTRFTRRLTQINDPAPGGGYFVGDLPDEAVVVTQGAQMLLSEEFRPPTQSSDTGDGD